MTALDDSHLASWIESAGDPICHFPVQNLPLGIFSVTSCERTVMSGRD
jgi:hypothetical protein